MICAKHPYWQQPEDCCPDCLWNAAGTIPTRKEGDAREEMIRLALSIAAVSVPPVVAKVVLMHARDSNRWKAIACAREWAQTLGRNTYAG